MELSTQLGLLAGSAIAVLGEIRALKSLGRMQRLMAFSALAQVGYIVIGISLGTLSGLAGAAAHFMFQAGARALWYLSLTRLSSGSGNNALTLDGLRGAGARQPFVALLLGFAVFAAIGLGPFKAPGGKGLILFAAVEGGHWLTALAMAAASLCAAIYTIRIVQAACLEKSDVQEPQAGRGVSSFPLMAGLAGALMLACLFPEPLVHMAQGFAASLTGKAAAALPELEGGWPLPVLIPYVGAFVLYLAGRSMPSVRNILVGVFAAAMVAAFWAESGLAPLQQLFGGLFALAGALIAVYSIGYMEHEKGGNHYFFFLFLMIASLIGLATAPTQGGLFAFWEIMTFSSYMLVVHKRSREALDAGKLYFVMCAGGAYAMQVGLFALQAAEPHAGLAQAATAFQVFGPLAALGIALVMLAGFGVKAGLFPLHSWLPAAHPVAPSSISAPLSGLLTKAGVLGLAVLAPLMAAGALSGGGQSLSSLLAFVAAVTFVLGEVMALRQSDIKRMLAYSTLAQIGEVTLILSIGTWAATTGALTHVVNHAVMKDLLFLAAGGLIMRAGTQQLDGLKGLGKAMPFTGVCMAIGLVSIMGLPLTGGFFSKFLMLHAAVTAGHAWTAALILAGSLIGCVYYGKIIKVLYFNAYTGKPVQELPVSMRAALGVFAAAALVSGVFPQAWAGLVIPTADALVPAGEHVLASLSVTWTVSALLPILGAAAAIWFRADLKKAGICATASLILAVVALLAESGSWGGYQLAFAALVLLTGACNIAYSTGYMTHSHTGWRFIAVFLTMIAGLVGMASATSLVAFFCFWEVMSSWPLFFAIIHEESPAARKEGTKYFLFNLAGASFLFLGVLLLGTSSGGYGFTDVTRALAAQPSSQWLFAVGLIVLGMLMKAAMLPVRIDWQMHPPTAPTPVSGYISAMLLKCAPFGIVLVRFVLARDVSPESAQALDSLLYVGAWIGGITILYAGIQALVQTGIKEMLIYSTVSQLGYIVLGVCLATPLGVAGGLLHLFNHMIFKNLAFLCAGALMFSTHAHSLHELGGIGRKMPLTLLAFAAALFSAAGMPPFNGFSSKFILYYALIEQGEVVLAIIAILTSVITMAYFLKFMHSAFFGQLSPAAAHAKEPGLFMRLPILILSGLCLLTGLFPGLGLMPIAAIETSFGLTPPVVGLSGVLSGPGAMDVTLLGFMIIVTGGGLWYGATKLMRTARRTAIHTCGEAVDIHQTHLGPSDIFATPLQLLSRMTRGYFQVKRAGGHND